MAFEPLALFSSWISIFRHIANVEFEMHIYDMRMNRDNLRKWRARKESLGLCTQCGKNPIENSKKSCRQCIKKGISYNKKRKLALKLSNVCTMCGSRPLKSAIFCDQCLRRAAAKRLVLKLTVFNVYGGPRCVGCGESELACLSMDHINGGGNRHRREVGSHSIYDKLKKNNYPPGFRVLCMNCQFRAYYDIKLPLLFI